MAKPTKRPTRSAVRRPTTEQRLNARVQRVKPGAPRGRLAEMGVPTTGGLAARIAQVAEAARASQMGSAAQAAARTAAGQAERNVPAWIRRAQQGQGTAKDLTGVVNRGASNAAALVRGGNKPAKKGAKLPKRLPPRPVRKAAPRKTAAR